MITGTGVFSIDLRYGDAAESTAAAAELESLGYTAVWVPNGGDDLFGALERLLAATSTMTVATGIMSIARQTPESLNAWWEARPPEQQARLLLGLGVGHRMEQPLATMRSYLDALTVPNAHRCLAALGPRMLGLARDHSAGAFPYLVTPEHTATAREILGPDALLACEQGVVLETDAIAARAIAREELGRYAKTPNYANNWMRMGFTDDDVTSLSDHIVDALIAWGDVDAIARRVAEHRSAGANHVSLQVVPSRGFHHDAWKALAGV